MKKKPKKKSVALILRNYFITGVVVLIPIGFTLYLSKILIGLSSKTSRFSETTKNSQAAEVPSVEEILQHVHRRPEDNALLSKEELDDELAKIMAEDSSDNEK